MVTMALSLNFSEMRPLKAWNVFIKTAADENMVTIDSKVASALFDSTIVDPLTIDLPFSHNTSVIDDDFDGRMDRRTTTRTISSIVN